MNELSQNLSAIARNNEAIYIFPIKVTVFWLMEIKP